MTEVLAELGRSLNFRAAHGDAGHLPPLVLLTDQERLADPLPAARALPPGSAVILRHYGERYRAELARALAEICRARGLAFLVAGDGGLAAQVGADGLHLPEAALAEARAWRQKRPGWLMTMSAHSGPALARAAAAGADAALLGPVFATKSHPGSPTLGPLRFARLVRRAGLPVYALGGINDGNGRQLAHSGAVGIAGIEGLALLK